MSVCISQIIATLRSGRIICRTLPHVVPSVDACGRPKIHAGNSAVSAEVFVGGENRLCLLKCYTRPKGRLAQIYGREYHPSELYVYDISGRGTWVDVVVRPWIEGPTLDGALREAVAAQDTERLGELSRRFDRMAADLLGRRYAHGDLKPENIVVTDSGMELVDWDAAWLPSIAENEAVETGTPGYQHPLRTARLYDKSIDDYPIALISTMLASLAADCGGMSRSLDAGGGLFSPADAVAGRDRALRRAEDLLARRGEALHYRIARLLHSPVPQLPSLKTMLDYLCMPRPESSGFDGAELERGPSGWGYVRAGEWIVPPLYDSGFEPSEGLALVELGGCRHFISCDGRSKIECSQFDWVKPMRAGRAEAHLDGDRFAIWADGRIERLA